MGRRPLTLAACAALAFAVLCGAALAAGGHHHHHHHGHHHKPKRPPTYVPPSGRTFHGVSDTHAGLPDVKRFQRQVGAHPAVLEDFYHWNTPLETGALQRWRRSSTRGVLSLSTAPGGGSEIISPGQIAAGHGDHYIAHMAQRIAKSRQVVYLRLMPEMNGYWNPYSAYNQDGSPRGTDHSTKAFREAWRRVAIIMRGGKIAKINVKLRKLGMPKLLRAKSSRSRIYVRDGLGKRIQKPKVALIWNPQTIGSPNVAGNAAKRYWPGAKYVDWVGADIYSKFASPRIRSAFTRFYASYKRFPFAVGEYSPWDNDKRGHFVRWLFKWARHHGRARMLVYYRSVVAGSPYDINHFPRARRVLRRELGEKTFMPFAPGVHRAHGHHHR